MPAPRTRRRRLLPRTLMARSLAILLVPLIALQLLVGLVFFQRHYQRVTEQMTAGIARPLDQALSRAEALPNAAAARAALSDAGRALGLDIELTAADGFAPGTRRTLLDVSGATLIERLRRDIDRPMAIDLTTSSRAAGLAIATRHGIARTAIPRSRLTVSNPHQLLVLTTVAAIVLAAIAVAFLRNQIRPILRLAAAAEAFGKGRTLALKPTGAEEVRRAATAFLDMRNRIERHIDQRTLMLSGVSHDLRTPLTRMKLTLAMMEESEETRDLAADVDQMERTVRTFLDFAKGDNAESPIETDPYALAEELVAENRRAGFEVALVSDRPGPEAARFPLRPNAIRRALQNLLDNARRYGAQTRLSVGLYQNALVFRVEDDGPGIEATDRESVLQPFCRLDDSRNLDESPGAGLGLSIALDIAHAHGGSLTLGESVALGGLSADLVLPR